MTDDEIRLRQQRDRQARASLAIEGMPLSADSEAMFAEFNLLRLSDDECRARILQRHKGGTPIAAE